VHETTTLLLVTLPNIHRFNFFSLADSSINLNVSQASVATYARCGGIFNIHLTTNLPRYLSVNFSLIG